VIATGLTHSVKGVLEVAFAQVGLDYRDHVDIDPELLRPAEVYHLPGDFSKACPIGLGAQCELRTVGENDGRE
jgi:GDPmannose 4,6-dehydratase